MTPVSVAIDLRLAGYRAGGIARYATELAAALDRVDDIDLIPLRSHQDETGGDRAVRLRTPPHHRLERRAIHTELLLKRLRPDVYHATDFIAPKLGRTPVVATVHDLEFIRHPEYLDEAGLRYYGQLHQSKGWTSAWITPSQWTADDLSTLLDVDPGDITVVPHGIPRALSARPAVPRQERTPHLLAVGTVEPRKRLDLLLDALDLMPHPPMLHIVGRPGWNIDDLERRIRRTAHVQWDDDTGDGDLWQHYRTAWAVVIPSESEGFGLVALEAMATGTPVISSGRGALPEVTGRAALTPESDTPEAWATAIGQMIDDEHLWNELSAFGQRRAAAFTWQRAASETAAVYRRVAGR